jgi:hypothetical protein
MKRGRGVLAVTATAVGTFIVTAVSTAPARAAEGVGGTVDDGRVIGVLVLTGLVVTLVAVGLALIWLAARANSPTVSSLEDDRQLASQTESA